MSRGDRAFLAVAALAFAASAALTVAWCASMAAAYCVTGPSAATISMAWRPPPGTSWLGAAASFLAMWAVMMVAMMLPSLVPVLRRYRAAIARARRPGSGTLTVVVATGYFFVWTLLGAAAFPAGIALAELRLQIPAVARTIPLAAGIMVLLAGAVQLSAWKAHRLACCRGPGARPMPASAGDAWRHGWRLGADCVLCCANLTAVLFALGVMDLGAMAAVMAAITAERLAPERARAALAIGIIVTGLGLFLVVQAVATG